MRRYSRDLLENLFIYAAAVLSIDLRLDDAANSKMMGAILNSHFYYINVNIARRLITRHMALFLQDGAEGDRITRERFARAPLPFSASRSGEAPGTSFYED